jgi:hypothetical protein
MKGNIACLVRLLGGHMLVTHESAGSIPVQGAQKIIYIREQPCITVHLVAEILNFQTTVWKMVR